MACFTGDYPMEVPQELDKLGLEPPAWARDRHDIDWEHQAPSEQRVWINPATIT
jgi:hypothetical protein